MEIHMTPSLLYIYLKYEDDHIKSNRSHVM